MPVRLSLSPDRPGEWRVSLDDTLIVCFSGPSAREQAERRSRELAALLQEATVVEAQSDADQPVRNPTPA